MENQNSLIGTAMLSTIWEKEKKDTLELVIPFIKYSIGQLISIDERVELGSVADYLSTNFGFYDMPYSVLQKAFKRLTKKKVLKKENGQYYLCIDLSKECRNVSAQLDNMRKNSADVIDNLNVYLNKKHDSIFKKQISEEEVSTYFVKFLESNGYFIYSKIEKLQEVSPVDNKVFYYIAQFILEEYEGQTLIFSYIENIVKGFLLSHIIYGYVDTDYNEKFKDVYFYLDTTLLLYIFGLKSDEKNKGATQLLDLIRKSNIRARCFEHTYAEIISIIEAYKHNIPRGASKSIHTIEFFDNLQYSRSDVERYLLKLEDIFKENNIEITQVPYLSSDDSCIVKTEDYSKSIGEEELKKFLSLKLNYKKDEALDNDVKSISAISTMRNSKSFTKIEECKAIFVTTNTPLVYWAKEYTGDNDNCAPLLISDMDLTTLLWLKNYKRFSDYPKLKLIENARISMEPTENIRNEFKKKIEQLQAEGVVNEEQAVAYNQLIFRKKEKIMELINADPDNISNIDECDLEKITRDYYNTTLNAENIELKYQSKQKDELINDMRRATNERIEQNGKKIYIVLHVILIILISLMLVIPMYRLIPQSDRCGFGDIISFVIGIIGLLDLIAPRYRKCNCLIRKIVNKYEIHAKKQEHMRINKN